jgi:hypothetical protein
MRHLERFLTVTVLAFWIAVPLLGVQHKCLIAYMIALHVRYPAQK